MLKPIRESEYQVEGYQEIRSSGKRTSDTRYLVIWYSDNLQTDQLVT